LCSLKILFIFSPKGGKEAITTCNEEDGAQTAKLLDFRYAAPFSFLIIPD
jgi:hypothetical protein